MRKFGIFLMAATVLICLGLAGCNNGTTDEDGSTITFTPGSPVVVGNQIIHENPKLELYVGVGEENGATFDTETGAITIKNKPGNGYGFYYPFPIGLEMDWTECLDIKIEYTANITTAPAELTIKDGQGSFDDIDVSGGSQYVTLEEGSGKSLTFLISEFPLSLNGDNEPGISFQHNNWSVTAEREFTVRITKITFTKAEPYAYGNPEEIDGKLVHVNPQIDASGGAQLNNITGVVTMDGNNQRWMYKFPDGWDDYEKVTFYYTTVVIDSGAQGNIKDAYDSWDSILVGEGYPTWVDGDGSLTYDLSVFNASAPIPGISCQYNLKDYTILIIKVEFWTPDPADELIVNDPEFESVWGASATVETDGWVTWSGNDAAIAWAFPAGYEAYSSITIYYETDVTDADAGSGHSEIIVKRPMKDDMSDMSTLGNVSEGNAYPWIDTSPGSLTYSLAQFDGCIGFQLNDSGNEYKIKITEIKFHN